MARRPSIRQRPCPRWADLDIDLHRAVTDESTGWFTGHWSDIARKTTPLVLAGPIPGVLGGFAITPEWLHLDLVFHPRSQCDPAALTSVKPPAAGADRGQLARQPRASYDRLLGTVLERLGRAAPA
jgi:hypothetical protein